MRLKKELHMLLQSCGATFVIEGTRCWKSEAQTSGNTCMWKQKHNGSVVFYSKDSRLRL